MNGRSTAAETASKSTDEAQLFDAGYYLRQRPELIGAAESPYQHYLRVGSADGVDPHPMFWNDFYCERYSAQLKQANPLEHFLTEGWKLGLDPNPFFSTRQYEEMFPDVKAHGINPALHYAQNGGYELNRTPNASFYASAYARRRKLDRGVNPLFDFFSRIRAHSLRRFDDTTRDPDYSIIILNYNKAVLTLQSVLDIFDSRNVGAIEIIVVDNGSSADDMELLSRWMPRGVKLLRLSTNRFFGEGNNIGVDASRGKFVLFLNNDAFLEADTLFALTNVLDSHPDAGAVGPKFLYPDGRIQEAGGFLSSCGIVTQRGKFLQNVAGRYERTEAVDYVSAACLLVPRRYLDAISGFDLSYEPAYYEDVDLCFKLRLLGLRTYYCGSASVSHIENATSGDQSLGLQLNDIVAINREKFIAKWSTYIETSDPRDAAVVLASTTRNEPVNEGKPVAVIMTPYHLVPGGGERYILTMAQTLSRTHQTILVTPERYSSYRLNQLGAELEIDLSHIERLTTREISQVSDCELYISIGNELLPQSRGIGARRYYVCQFPFPMASSHAANAWESLQTYDAVIVYSEFSARCFAERGSRLFDSIPPIKVLAPPVPMYNRCARKVSGRILNVGRFTSEGHCKRQDTLVDAFRILFERSGREDLELHLVGTVPPDPLSRAYFTDVSRRAAGLPVFIHLSAAPDTVRELYETSSFYWHATGFGRSERINAELMEHFGITVVEAMSSGVIPLVYAAGGPAEIVEHQSTGIHWRTIDDLVMANVSLLTDTPDADRMRAAAALAARTYDRCSFDRRLDVILNESACLTLVSVG